MSYTFDLFKQLFAPFPKQLKRTKKQGGQNITYVEWVDYVIRAHQQFPHGYSKEIRNVTEAGGQLLVTVRITDGQSGLFQEAMGVADAAKTSWGGAMAEAESQAFRRAMANWGLGLEMYLDDQTYEFYANSNLSEEDDAPEPAKAEEPEPEVVEEPTPRQVQVLSDLGRTLAAVEGQEDFVEEQRAELRGGMNKKKAGIVIRRFRARLEDLGLEDPTKSGGDS